MYRFLLFVYEDYYPCGGLDDCKFKFNSFSDLVKEKRFLNLDCDNIEIYDVEYDNVVYISNKEEILNEFGQYLG